VEVVKELIKAKADVNATNELYTALMLASENGHMEVVKVLLAAGADVNVKSRTGNTALSQATEQGHSEIIELLKKAGATA